MAPQPASDLFTLKRFHGERQEIEKLLHISNFILFQIFAWVSLGVVLVSTFTFVLGTFPEFQKVNISQYFSFKYFSIPPFDLQEEDTGQPPPYPEAVVVMDIVGKEL